MLLRRLFRYLRKNREKKKVLNSHHQVAVYNVEKKEYNYKKKGFTFYESVLFNLKKNDYKKYISTWEAYQPRFYLSKYSLISDDKYLFSLVFGKYIETPTSYGLINNGKFESLVSGLNESNLYDFFLENNGGVIKDRFGYNGYNIFVFRVKDKRLYYKNELVTTEHLSEIISSFEKGLVQSILSQGSFENSIYDKSINTIRMITIRKKGDVEHEVVCAVQRIGSDKCAPVDNFSQGGFSSLINIETGELGSLTSPFSKDNDMNQVFFDRHPDNGNIVKGKVIPNWQNIKEKIVQTTRKLPFYDYLAWDIVLKDNGIAVIEINMKSSLCVVQVHGGMRDSALGEAYRRMNYMK